MIEKIQKILEREISRINSLSEKSGLTLDDIRALDLLLKSVKNFSAKPEDAPPPPGSPEAQSTESLLDDLTDSIDPKDT